MCMVQFAPALSFASVLICSSANLTPASVHFDVLKTSTLEMFPTYKYCCFHRRPCHSLTSPRSFVLHYADTTELRGFRCKDHVKFGRVTGDLSCACLYHCNSPDFNDSDGILGFGRYVNDARLPSPLFTSLTDPSNLLPGSPQLSPKFRCVPAILLCTLFLAPLLLVPP